MLLRKIRLGRFEMTYHSVVVAKERGRCLVSISGLIGVQEWVVNQQKRNLLLYLCEEEGVLRIDINLLESILLKRTLKTFIIVGIEA